MNHAQLCERAAQWLRGTMKCNIAVHEVVSVTAEKPDAIGWHPYKSTLIEVKMSRADFLADAKKRFRQHPQKGMGNYRYYLCPENLLNADDMPEKWGLLYHVKGNRIKVIKRAEKQLSNLSSENTMLVSILKRLTQGDAYMKGRALS